MKKNTRKYIVLIVFALLTAAPEIAFAEMGELGVALSYGILTLAIMSYSIIYIVLSIVSLFTMQYALALWYHILSLVLLVAYYFFTKYWWWAGDVDRYTIATDPENDIRNAYYIILVAILLNSLFWLKWFYKILFNKHENL